MKRGIEKTYGNAVKGIFFAVNPLKKKIMKTNCTVHKFIIIQAIEILKINGYTEEYKFFKKYVKALNIGVTWADQDFKSSNHFYHITRGRGLYGFSDALTECKKYYNRSLQFLKDREIQRALFYFGASCHLVQDVTVPHHVNNKLLNSHRKFELWIIGKLMTDYSFTTEEEPIMYDKVDDFIKNNAIMANSTYIKNRNIESREERYGRISMIIIKEAERTTAGFMLKYFNEIKNLKILP